MRREVSVLWKCYDPGCQYLGTEELQKMQNHLSFHGLPPERINELAGNLLNINRNLQGWKFMSCTSLSRVVSTSKLAPDWLHKSKQLIRSQVSKLASDWLHKIE